MDHCFKVFIYFNATCIISRGLAGQDILYQSGTKATECIRNIKFHDHQGSSESSANVNAGSEYEELRK
jgi:hypothetical protein